MRNLPANTSTWRNDTITRRQELIQLVADEVENHFHTVGCGICGSTGTMFCDRCTNKTSVQSMYSCSKDYARMVAEDILEAISEYSPNKGDTVRVTLDKYFTK